MDENFDKMRRGIEDAMDSFELGGIYVEAAVDANLAADRAEAAAEDAEQSYQNTLAYDQQGEQWMLAAQAAAIDAEGSKVAAKASEQAAATSESNAKDSELLAEGYAEDAATSESNALSYKQDAETARNQALNYRNDALSARDTAQQHQQSAEASKDAAATSASQANASAQSAESSKDLAYRWANAPEDQPVEQGEFSAYHWAKKAEGFVGGPYLRVSNNLSEVDPEVARDNLGLGSAATRDVGTSSGNVMEVGAFGFGAVSNRRNLNDLNELYGAPTQVIYYSTNVDNRPSSYGSVFHVGTTQGNSSQLSIGYRNQDGLHWRGGYQGLEGKPWLTVIDTGNILKTTGN